jgi:hypothetical protein
VKKTFLLLMVVALLVGCRGRTFDAPKNAHDPLLQKLKEPPVNEPRRAPRVVAPDTRRAPTLPAGDQPGMFVSSDGHLLARAVATTGRVVHTAGVIDFTGDKGDNVHILYRLPKQLEPIPELKGTGNLVFADQTNPGGPGKRVIVTMDSMPLLAEIWLKSATPITVEVSSGLQVRQTPAMPPDIRSVPVSVLQSHDATSVAVGTRTAVKTASGVLQIFLAASDFTDSSDPTGQSKGGYILHVWIARAGS